MADYIFGHPVEEWAPQEPNQGPPLPEFLKIYWPWYKPAEPPEEPEPGMANLYGLVTNSQTGAGISGVRVLTTGKLTETNANGNYAIIDMYPGEYTVEFSKDGYETKQFTFFIAEGNNQWDVQLVPTGAPPGGGVATLSGIITDDSTGDPVSGVEVTLEGREPVLSDSGGNYQLLDIESDSFPITVAVYFKKDGYQDQNLSVSLAEGDNVLDVQMVPTGGPGGGVEISGVNVYPTQLTNAKHEYETSLGLGYWGDPFTIAITFDNPFDYDVWVKPDYAFGHLNGGALGFVNGDLQGFTAETLLYFRLLLQSAYIEGDYSYDIAWQKPWDARGQNVSSGLAFVYDPDGVPRMGDERWLKIPAGGSVTTTKEVHLGAKLSVKGWKCTTCGEIITGGVEAHYEEKHPGIEITCWSWGGYSGCYFTDGSGNAADQVDLPAAGVAGFHDLCVAALRALHFVYDPGCGQTRVGGQIVTLNWRLEELSPVAMAVPDAIEITAPSY